jgi:arylsulfatase A-like enzyme
MRRRWHLWIWLSCAAVLAVTTTLAATDRQHRVVVVVWDGMRPDFVTTENTPTLWKLGQEGVVFQNHHPVYFSATNVNGVALATGMYPGHAGLIANHEYRPQIDHRKPIDVENPEVVSKGDELSHGNYIMVPTMAELVRKGGGRTVIAASKTVGLLHDRPHGVPLTNDSITLSAGRIWPNDSAVAIEKRLGTFPKAHVERDLWTTRALTEILWETDIPAFSVLWLGEPDLTQHETAPGAPPALRGMKGADDNLAAVLAAIDRHQARAFTDVLVVSDHGFSTIEHEIDLPKILADAGFDVATEFKSEGRPGQIMMVGGGGSVLFYVVNQEKAVIQKLVEFLQKSEFAGVLFTKQTLEGTFSLTQGQIDSVDAPDVAMSFHWRDEPNEYGVRGLIDADWQRGAGKGTHATLSRYDMHNTLVAAGPDFRRGWTDDIPSGNVDLAPTALQILQIKSGTKMDGRILSEALVNGESAAAKPETRTIEATRRFPTGTWHQSLQISRVGTTVYLDEGNGRFEPANRQMAPEKRDN